MAVAVRADQHYDAFISYSHTLDGALAVALQTGLQRFAKPWYRPRALRVFRDDANLSANADLWASIEVALASSTWFVLMASPAAAASPWVDREVRWWLEHRSTDRLLVVLTEGEFDAALPPALVGAFTSEPRWVDLRWLHAADQVDQANPRLRECVADVAAAVRNVPKDALVGEHIRQHRRTIRLARGAVTALALLLAAASVAAVLAVIRGNDAVAAQRLAIARGMVGQAEAIRDRDPAAALRFGIAAQTVDPSLLTRASLAEGVLGSSYRATLPAMAAVGAMAVTPDGRVMAVGVSGSVQMWGLSDPDHPRPLGPPVAAHRGAVDAIVFDKTGTMMITGGGDGTVHVFDAGDPAHLRSRAPGRKGHNKQVFSLALSPDGRWLASGGMDRTVVLWDLADPAAPRRAGSLAADYAGSIWGLAFSPYGRRLTAVAPGLPTVVVVWDVADPANPRLLGRSGTADTGPIAAVAFSPDGRTMALGDIFDLITLWDISDPAAARPAEPAISGLAGNVNQLAFSRDGHTLVAGTTERTVLTWDISHPESGPAVASRARQAQRDRVTALVFLPDGHHVLSGSDDASVVVWDIDDAPPAPTLGGPLSGHDDAVTELARSGDGRLLVTSGGHQVLLWDVTDRTRPRRVGPPLTGTTYELPDASGPASALQLSRDGHTLVTTGTAADGSPACLIWDVSDPSRPARLGAPLPLNCYSMALSPDGTLLAVGNDDGTLALWDLTDRAHPLPEGPALQAGKQWVNTLSFAADGAFLASGSGDLTVLLWDLHDRARPRRIGPPLTGHTGIFIAAAAFAPDGRTLVTGSDREILLWDLSDPQLPRPLGLPLTVRFGRALAFSPDGGLLAAGGNDKSVTLWDMTDRTEPRPLGGALAGVSAPLAFSSDGRTLLARGPDDKAVSLRDLVPLEELRADPVRAACARVGTSLARETWAFYAPDVPYRDACTDG